MNLNRNDLCFWFWFDSFFIYLFFFYKKCFLNWFNFDSIFDLIFLFHLHFHFCFFFLFVYFYFLKIFIKKKNFLSFSLSLIRGRICASGHLLSCCSFSWIGACFAVLRRFSEQKCRSAFSVLGARRVCYEPSRWIPRHTIALDRSKRWSWWGKFFIVILCLCVFQKLFSN